MISTFLNIENIIQINYNKIGTVLKKLYILDNKKLENTTNRNKYLFIIGKAYRSSEAKRNRYDYLKTAYFILSNFFGSIQGLIQKACIQI